MGVTKRGMVGDKGGGLAVNVTVVLGCIFLAICFLGARDMDRQVAAERAKWNYEVCIGNWVGTTCEPCVSYEKKDNTYILYDSNKMVIGEVTGGEGYHMLVRKR